MRGFALFQSSPFLLLRSMVILTLAAGCAGQAPAAPPAASAMPPASSAAAAPANQNELPLNRRIENQLRSQYSISPLIDITVHDVKPSDVPGFDTLPVTIKTSS